MQELEQQSPSAEQLAPFAQQSTHVLPSHLFEQQSPFAEHAVGLPVGMQGATHLLVVGLQLLEQHSPSEVQTVPVARQVEQ
jgi:hypothetical protein